MSYQPKVIEITHPIDNDDTGVRAGDKTVWYKPGKMTWFVMKYPRHSMEPDMEISGHRDVELGVEPSQWDMHESDEAIFIVELFTAVLSVG